MINDLEIALRAENPVSNCWRDYSLVLGRDLLGDWCISVRWGRIGTAGSTAMHGFGNRNEAVTFASTLLKRRLTAPRRIGCPYRLIASSGVERFGLAGVVRKFSASTA
jgi:predicted DNA-binding WGR domain protein